MWLCFQTQILVFFPFSTFQLFAPQNILCLLHVYVQCMYIFSYTNFCGFPCPCLVLLCRKKDSYQPRPLFCSYKKYYLNKDCDTIFNTATVRINHDTSNSLRRVWLIGAVWLQGKHCKYGTQFTIILLPFLPPTFNVLWWVRGCFGKDPADMAALCSSSVFPTAPMCWWSRRDQVAALGVWAAPLLCVILSRSSIMWWSWSIAPLAKW